MKTLAHFLAETFSLKRIRRSSYQTLAAESGSIAEHSFCTAMIGYCMAKIEKADVHKVVLMCLFHDLAETRVGDANFVQKRYQILQEKLAMQDMVTSLPTNIKEEIIALFTEFEKGETKEAVICHEADKLEQLLEEKEHADSGNSQAKGWMRYSMKNLKLTLSKTIGKHISTMKPGDWWSDLLSRAPIHKGHID